MERVDSDPSRPPLELHYFKMRLNGRKPKTEYDPDEEVSGWELIDVASGFPFAKPALHVPEDGLLIRLGLITSEGTKRMADRRVSYYPPEKARLNALRGLEMQVHLNKGVQGESLVRARQIIERQGLTEKEVVQMAKFFDLYGARMREVDRHGEPTAASLDCQLWGGEEAATWANRERQALASQGRAGFRLSAEPDDGATAGKKSRTILEVQSDIEKAGTQEKQDEGEEGEENLPEPKKLSPAEMKKDPDELLPPDPEPTPITKQVERKE